MARRRQSSKKNTNTTRARSAQAPTIAALSNQDVAERIERARRRRDARRAAASHEQRRAKQIERRAPKKLRAEFKAHGFPVTDKGVKVDGPRDKERNPLKGARTELLKGGVVKQSLGERRDFIYGFTPKEKREFAKNPGAFTKKKMTELERLFPSLRRRKKQVRLQWGAYQAQKDFTPTYFTKQYFASTSPEEVRRVGKRKAKPRADKLTGLHIVVHIPKRSTARKSSEGKRRGKKKGSKR